MYPALGCYGPSLQDQGIGPEDAPEPKIPVLVKVHLRLYAEFYDEDGESGSDDVGWVNFKNRLSISDFKRFDADLGRLRRKWSGEPFLHLWVIRYLEELCLKRP